MKSLAKGSKIAFTLVGLYLLVIGSYNGSINVACEKIAIELSNTNLNLSLPKVNRTHKIQNIDSDHINSDRGNKHKNCLYTFSEPQRNKLEASLS